MLKPALREAVFSRQTERVDQAPYNPDQAADGGADVN